MKDKTVVIALLVGIGFACLLSCFLWGMFSIINSSISAADWNTESRFLYGAFSLLFLFGSVSVSGVYIESKINN